MNQNDFTVTTPKGEVVHITANIGTGLSGVAIMAAERSITLDGRKRGKDKLDTFIHEALHILFRDKPEKEISDSANFVAEILWKAGYRRKSEKKQ